MVRSTGNLSSNTNKKKNIILYSEIHLDIFHSEARALKYDM